MIKIKFEVSFLWVEGAPGVLVQLHFNLKPLHLIFFLLSYFFLSFQMVCLNIKCEGMVNEAIIPQ